MIPALLFVGLVAGRFIGHRRLGRLALVAAAVSLVWGLGVGVADESVLTFAGGAALASLNFVVGAAVGVGLRALTAAPGQ